MWKNPDDLNPRQRQQLDWVAKTEPRLWRAYLLKEGLRYVFAVKGAEGKEALDRWLSWARRSQLPAFIQLAKRITRHRQAIDANLEHGLSQGLIESTNTKIRLLARIAFGFHGPQPLIALALLALRRVPHAAFRRDVCERFDRPREVRRRELLRHAEAELGHQPELWPYLDVGSTP